MLPSISRFLTAGLLFAGLAVAATTTGASNVTFNKDVLPILQKTARLAIAPAKSAPWRF